MVRRVQVGHIADQHGQRSLSRELAGLEADLRQREVRLRAVHDPLALGTEADGALPRVPAKSTAR